METSEQSVDELREQTVQSMRIAWEKGDHEEVARLERQHINRVTHCCTDLPAKEIEACSGCGLLYLRCQRHSQDECPVCMSIALLRDTKHTPEPNGTRRWKHPPEATAAP